MAALPAGVRAPDFSLESLGGMKKSLKDVAGGKPVLFFFFKVECPICQLATPFVERLHKAYGGGRWSVVGISQDDRAETGEYRRRHGMTFETLLDGRGYPASNAYGIDTVPSLFAVGPGGRIEKSFIGWQKKEMLELGRLAAAAAGVREVSLLRPGEDVPDTRAG